MTEENIECLAEAYINAPTARDSVKALCELQEALIAHLPAILTALRAQDAVPVAAFRHPRNDEADRKDGWVQFTDPNETTGYAIRKRIENPAPQAVAADGELLEAINAEIDTWEQAPLHGAMKRALAKVIAARPTATNGDKDAVIALLARVMDAADRYNGVHTQSKQPMARMQGELMLAISAAYRGTGLNRETLAALANRGEAV